MESVVDGILASIGIHKGALITGLIGSFLSFKFVAQLGTFGRATAFIGGAFSAGILAPVLVDWLSFKPAYIAGVGFIVGALGMSVLAAVLQAIKDLDLVGLVKSRLGIRSNDPKAGGE